MTAHDVAAKQPAGDFTVIGAVQIDVVASPVTDLPPGGASLLVDQMSVRLGGAGANAALAFADAGVKPRLVGCVGDDHLGTWMCDELKAFDLDRDLVTVAGERSGLTMALQSPDRDRTFLTYLGVNATWEGTGIAPGVLDTRNLLLCDYFVMPGMHHAAARVLTTARSQGARTFFDTAWDPAGFRDTKRAQVLELLPWVDVFLPNEAEAYAVTGVNDDPLAAARILQEASGGWVVVKLGSRGCLALGPDAVELSQTAPSVEVADTIGAGDAFNAGLVLALDQQPLDDRESLERALRYAVEFASEIIARPSDDRYRPLGDIRGVAARRT